MSTEDCSRREKIQLPFILSPSLGYPLIISSDNPTLDVIVVADSADISGNWKLVSSSSNNEQHPREIILYPDNSSITELAHKDTGHLCDELSESREQFSKEVLQLFQPEARLYKISLSLFNPSDIEANKNQTILGFENFLRQGNNGPLPNLYNLFFEHNHGKQTKLHSICLTENKNKQLRFAQLTDLHIARRNDLIKSEISVEEPVEEFCNFNENLRRAIRKYNNDFDKGELDFIILSGDVVDFVEHGISHNPDKYDNNWHVFLEILTGQGQEPDKGNTGLKVPVFTSTGNHDWRLYPYDIKFQPEIFGLTGKDREKVALFDHRYYSTTKDYKDKLDDVYTKLLLQGSPIIENNLSLTNIKFLSRFVLTILYKLTGSILKTTTNRLNKAIFPLIAAIYSSSIEYIGNNKFEILFYILIFFIIYLIQNLLLYYAERSLKNFIDYSVIPIEATSGALEDYFLHINPYFNYIFSFGNNYFTVLDTGPDCLIAQDLWDEGKKKLHKINFRETIGGAADSQAFFRINEYYNNSQLAWFEHILQLISKEAEGNQRIIVIVHAPPINTKDEPVIPDGITETRITSDIRYGTINHYLSQFFYLCRGKKQGHVDYHGPVVDLILSGHTHHAREYRIGEENQIYFGNYSQYGMNREVFDSRRPFSLQTAACGPREKGYPDTPYNRSIRIEQNGDITEFKHGTI